MPTFAVHIFLHDLTLLICHVLLCAGSDKIYQLHDRPWWKKPHSQGLRDMNLIVCSGLHESSESQCRRMCVLVDGSQSAQLQP